jgi:hypothetical protein
VSEYHKAYYQANKERLKAAAAKRRAEKPDECKAAVERWYQDPANRARRREYFKQYSKGERFKAAQLSYRVRKPGVQQARMAARRAAKLQRTPHWLSANDRNAMSALYQLSAIYSDALGIEFEVDHAIPLQGATVSGLHVPGNLRVITRDENRAKSNRIIEELL